MIIYFQIELNSKDSEARFEARQNDKRNLVFWLNKIFTPAVDITLLDFWSEEFPADTLFR